MAQLTRPLTEAEARAMLESWRKNMGKEVSHAFAFASLCVTGESHQFVRYDAKLDRVVYENVQHFYWTDPSPSDSRWMVPK